MKKILTNLFQQNIYFLAIIVSLYLIFIFRDFIFGDSLYVYTQTMKGGDDYRTYIPFISFSSNLFNDFTLYSFQLGLGDSSLKIAYYFLDPFNIPFYFLENNNISNLMIYVIMIKILAAAILCYKYLEIFNLSKETIFLSSLLYILIPYIFTPHYAFLTYFALTPLVLLMVERWFQYGKWLGLVLVLSFMAGHNLYFFYKLSFFLLFYAMSRVLFLDSSPTLKFTIALKTTVLYLLSLTLSSIILLPTIEFLTNTGRAGQSFFDFSYLLGFQSIIGSIKSGQWFGLPFFTFLLLPLIFLEKSKFKVIIIFFIGILLYLFLFNDFFTALLTGFNKIRENYFLYIFDCALIIGFAFSLECFFKDYNKKIFIYLLFIFFNLTYLSFVYSHKFFLNLVSSEVILLIYFLNFSRQKKFMIVSVLLLSISIYYNNKLLQNQITLWPHLKKIEVKNGYNDGTNKAIEYIHQLDKSVFYRIAKVYTSAGYNDSLMYGYNGLEIYQSMLNKDFKTFLAFEKVEALFKGGWQLGVPYNRKILFDLLDVKYLLSKSRISEDFGVRLLKKIDDIYIYKNSESSFGNFYTSFIYANKYINKLNYLSKDRVLTHSLVLKNQDIIEHNLTGKINSINAKNKKIVWKKAGYKIDEFDSKLKIELDELLNIAQLNINFTINAQKNGYVDIKCFNEFDFECLETHPRYRQHFAPRNLKLKKGQNRYQLEIKNREISGIIISSNQKVKIANLDLKYSKYNKNRVSSNFNGLRISEFENSNIKGDIDVNQSGVLLLPIIYDKGWKICIDGKDEKIIKVNGGLTGVYLDRGLHNIELDYWPPKFILGFLISFLTIVLLYIIHKRRLF